MRQAHEEDVLDALREHGASSRSELVRLTGLSRATLSEITSDLIRAKRVVVLTPDDDRATKDRRVGRVPQKLGLNPSAGAAFGIDFGHRRIDVAAVNASQAILGDVRRRHAPALSWEDRLSLAFELTEELARDHGIELDALAGVGVGVVGGHTNRVPDFEPVRDQIAEHFHCKVMIDNNTRLAGFAESVWGGAQGLRDVIYLRLSVGVGGAVLINGRIHQGPTGSAGEYGHVCVDPAGPACRCGNNGCLESFVSLDAMNNQAQAIGLGGFDELVEAADRGDIAAQNALGMAGRRIGLVLANSCNALGVLNIVLGGDLLRAGAHLVEPLRQALARHLLAGLFPRINLIMAELGEGDGALGAAALILKSQKNLFGSRGASEERELHGLQPIAL